MPQFGKALIVIGLSLVALGALAIVASKLGFKPFRLPGDIVWRGKNSTVYVPIATSLLLSILLTLLLSFLGRR